MLKGYFRILARDAVTDYKRRIFGMLEKNPGARLLDCGCGEGNFTLEVARRIGTKDILGIEISERNREKARARGIKSFSYDLNEKIPLESGSLDVICAIQVVEHLYDLDLFLSEIYRLLKRNAYAIISTINLASWHDIFALLLGWQPFSLATMSKKEIRTGNPFAVWEKRDFSSGWSPHIRAFTPRSLKEICQIYGFRIERLVGSGYYPLPPFLARLFCKLDKVHAAFITVKIRR